MVTLRLTKFSFESARDLSSLYQLYPFRGTRCLNLVSSRSGTPWTFFLFRPLPYDALFSIHFENQLFARLWLPMEALFRSSRRFLVWQSSYFHDFETHSSKVFFHQRAPCIFHQLCGPDRCELSPERQGGGRMAQVNFPEPDVGPRRRRFGPNQMTVVRPQRDAPLMG